MGDKAQAELDALVVGMTGLLLSFDGPATAYCGTGAYSTMYVSLCSAGIKPQGEESPTFERYDDAIRAYGSALWAMVLENTDRQLAWRCRPKLEGEPGKWRVYSRLAFV